MFELKKLVPKSSRYLRAAPRSGPSSEPTQRRLMVAALTLLLLALGFELYADRSFWFPKTPDAENQPQMSPTEASVSTEIQHAANPAPPPLRKSHAKQTPPQATPTNFSPSDSATPPITAITRTVLPPLEVEVVAGDVHRTIHPGSNSVHVDLQPNPLQPDSSQASAPPQEVSAAPVAADPVDTAASSTSNAAERVDMSADTANVLSEPVKPGYPLLARQMKVQGSVILQALIGRDGLIQDLRVLSGPPILASAAEEAVKQWHFKPHLVGADPVETQARITVNFTISTN
jgi:TonB family protein